MPGHPHFLGTLDSFLFRFVVRPFARVLHRGLAPARLLDAARADSLADKQQWSPGTLWVQDFSSDQRDRAHLYRLVFRGEEGGCPTFSVRVGAKKELRIVRGSFARAVLKRKQEAWERSGWVTHSDVAYLSAKLLGQQPAAARIQRILCRRFPRPVDRG